MSNQSPYRKRLAIIGGGSSGLITLKHALDALPDWEIVCFEKSDRIVGCWGDPYPGFISTSTKYTTQFACYPVVTAEVDPQGVQNYAEFFRDDEYGRYLESFADKFALRAHIRLQTEVITLTRQEADGRWLLSVVNTLHVKDSDAPQTTELFDAVVLCTGLAAEPKQADVQVPVLPMADLLCRKGLSHVRDQRIVVLGGGESAVDYAVRLSRPELNNRVFLSLYTGIRVSPRYHPIRGVPSDFLRNRLMLSIHEDLRNWIGQRFVEARIKYQELFERFFPSKAAPNVVGKASGELLERRKHWAYVLTKAAKDQLFNMFHNKSDGFLDAVVCGEITIVGPPFDSQVRQCRAFESNEPVDVNAQLIVPAIGYRSRLQGLSGGQFGLRDFYLGCCHVRYDNLFLVGFARPIIGNIPTIGEQQARYVSGLLAGKFTRDPAMVARHQADAQRHEQQFAKLNLDAIYPVEMFPYCDRLARLMGVYPSLRRAGSLLKWWRVQLAPATTLHYSLSESDTLNLATRTRIFMPAVFIGLLALLKPIDWLYRAARTSFAPRL